MASLQGTGVVFAAYLVEAILGTKMSSFREQIHSPRKLGKQTRIWQGSQREGLFLVQSPSYSPEEQEHGTMLLRLTQGVLGLLSSLVMVNLEEKVKRLEQNFTHFLTPPEFLSKRRNSEISYSRGGRLYDLRTSIPTISEPAFWKLEVHRS